MEYDVSSRWVLGCRITNTDIDLWGIGGEVPRLVAVEGEVGEDGRYNPIYIFLCAI